MKNFAPERLRSDQRHAGEPCPRCPGRGRQHKHAKIERRHRRSLLAHHSRQRKGHYRWWTTCSAAKRTSSTTRSYPPVHVSDTPARRAEADHHLVRRSTYPDSRRVPPTQTARRTCAYHAGRGWNVMLIESRPTYWNSTNRGARKAGAFNVGRVCMIRLADGMWSKTRDQRPPPPQRRRLVCHHRHQQAHRPVETLEIVTRIQPWRKRADRAARGRSSWRRSCL